MHNTDWELVLLSSFQHKGYRDRLTELLKSHPEWKERIREYEHNLVCPISPELSNKIGPVNHIIHLAAMSDVFFSVENPVWTIQNNINSTLTMLEYARDVEPETFLYFSTDEVYGPVEKRDGVLGAHHEWDPHKPSNAYAASKAASEDICYSYWRSYGVPLIVTNTMNNFGEMQSSSKYPVIIHGNPDGEPGSRYYIHSRNVADALLHILKLGASKHETGKMDEPKKYHIVGEKPLTNLELAQLIADLMGKPLKYEYLDFHSYNPAHDIHYGLEDNNLRSSGWKQPLSLEESLKHVIEWQTENPEWIR
jgi:dTDP-glucose 4,6-dehydratase